MNARRKLLEEGIIFLAVVLDRLIGRSDRQGWLSFFKKSSWVTNRYRIKGLKTYSHRDLVEFKFPTLFTKKRLCEELLECCDLIREALGRGRPLSLIRCGDGEAYFIYGSLRGNIGKRHYTSESRIGLINQETALRNLYSNDYVVYDSNFSTRYLWLKISGWHSFSNPQLTVQALYALVSSRRVFELSSGYKIGLIGSRRKLDIIERLMKNADYRKYLGVKKFENLIGVPDRGACNEPDKLLQDIVKQHQKSPCDIYLVGIGISKLYVLHSIRDHTGAVIVDVGHGLDAVAGIIPKDRSYFGLWQNFKLSNFDYSQVDILSQYVSEQFLKGFQIEEDRYV